MHFAETDGPPRARLLRESRPFNRNNAERTPETPGVYLIWQQIRRDAWKLFYVGSTDNLRTTLTRHLSSSEPDVLVRRRVANCVLAFDYLQEARGDVRQGIVKYLALTCHPESVSETPGPEVSPVSIDLSSLRLWQASNSASLQLGAGPQLPSPGAVAPPPSRPGRSSARK